MIVSSGDQNLTLSWSPPANNGFSIIQYNIYRSTLGPSSGFSNITSTMLSTFTDNYTLGNNTTAWYNVTAVNLLGESPPSNIASNITFAVPSQPQNLTIGSGIQNLTLTWFIPCIRL